MVILTVVAWARRDWSLTRRVYYTLLTLSAVAFLVWLYRWNLLGYWL